MKNNLLLLFLIIVLNNYAQICNNAGNVVVFSNYDGSGNLTTGASGRLNINIDQNIPNIKIGICSYERVTVNITGAFVGNVTAVRYAGYNAMGNCHCGGAGCNNTTTITGVPTGIITYCIMPTSPFNDPNGYGQIICAYQCSGGNQGGCNTPQQVVQYFMNTIGSGQTFRSHTSQYGCWANATHSLSNAGNCCLTVLPIELAYFDGYSNENKNILKWQTYSEKNNIEFEIQSSTDGFMFETIGKVKGGGNSIKTINYFFEDYFMKNKVTYYRLKQIDFDGSFEYSNAIVVDNRNKLESIYPIPANNFIVINKGFKLGNYRIINSYGNDVTDITVMYDDKINTESLLNGVYFIIIEDRKLKFTVQH